MAAEFFYRRVHIELLGGFAVDFENLVAGEETGSEAWGVFHGIQNGEHAAALRNHHAESAEFAARVLLHVFEIFRIHELAVRIELVEQASESVVGEVGVARFGFIHIVLPDELHGAGEELELIVGGVLRFFRSIGCLLREGVAGKDGDAEDF